VDRLHLINVFVSVVDANGFAGAARKLNISPPAVTRAISELEAHLGVRLLTRTTRVVRVTEAGRVMWRTAVASWLSWPRQMNR